VTGVAGQADLLSIQYVDAGHVRFALDHWGRSYQESPPVPVDYAGLHTLEIVLPTLDWPPPSDGGRIAGEIIVRLDGATAWRAPQEFYRSAASSLEIGANRIGGSTCDEAFSGGILQVARGDAVGAADSGSGAGRP